MKRKKTAGRPAKPADEVVRLEDLAPREDVKGGAGKLLFGERRETPPRAPERDDGPSRPRPRD